MARIFLVNKRFRQEFFSCKTLIDGKKTILIYLVNFMLLSSLTTVYCPLSAFAKHYLNLLPSQNLMSTRIPLSHERIVEAALALIEAVGIEGFSMRALGRQLNVDPMAIYHHLPNKDAVFDAIVEALWSGVACDAVPEGQDWQECLYKLFHHARTHLLTHPRAVLLMGTRPATTPALLHLIDRTLGHLHSTALPAHEAMALMDCLAAFTVGKVLGEVSQEQQHDKVATALQTLTPQSHPYLLQALGSGYAFAPATQFERGLRALITGWSAASPESV